MYLVEMQSHMNSFRLGEKGQGNDQMNYDQARITVSAKEHIQGTSE